MPTVPKQMYDPTQASNPLGDMTPGPSQVMMAAATMHGYGRLLADGTGAHSAALAGRSTVTGGGRGVSRMSRRSKGFSQRSR